MIPLQIVAIQPNVVIATKKHHSLLHIENTQTENQDQGDSSLTLNNHAYATIQDTVVLATAVVLKKNAKNEYKPCRLFLDSG
jgi:hypothetical protein